MTTTLRFLVGWLLLSATCLPARATDCPPGSIPLVNATGPYDWLQDFKRLETKYSRSKLVISQLRPYFYTGANPKACISIADLKRLSAMAQRVLGGQPDAFTKNFIAGVAGVANAQDAPAILPTPATTAPVATSQNEETTESGTNPALFTDANNADAQQITTLQLENKRLSEKKDGLFALLLGMGFVLLLTIAGGWWFFVRKPNQEQDQHAFLNKTPVMNTVGNNQSEAVSRLKTDLNRVNKERDEALKQQHEAEQARRDTEQAFAAYRKQYPQKPQPTPSGEVIREADSQVVKPVVPDKLTTEKAVFFLGTPSPAADGGMGTFLDIRQTQPDPRRSSYRFEPTNANEARFSFIDNPAIVSGAVRNPDTQLAPACDYGSVNANAQRIITETPGKAQKEGDVWMITQRAKIRFA